MFHVVWEFRVRPGAEGDFESRYGTDGDWVRLFRRGDGYLSTVLLRDRGRPGRYLVTDSWRDAGCYRAFQERFAAPYVELDRSCEVLTEEERCLGEFEEAGAGP